MTKSRQISYGVLPIGSDGQTLVANSANASGLGWNQNFAAGKNKIINGDFYFNQRNFSSTTTDQAYGFDRWCMQAGPTGCTYSAQTFTVGTAPVAGYEGKNFARLVTTGQTDVATYSTLSNRMEDVRTYAGQTVTVSFWAKAASGTPKVYVELAQNFGTGGSPSAEVDTGNQVTLSTSWARYSTTISVPSISGKTLGTNNNSYLTLNLWVSAGSSFNARTGSLGIQSNTFDFWGAQVEAGSVATAFTTATGTLQGELALAERYYAKSYSQGTAPTTATQAGIIYAPAQSSTANQYFVGNIKFPTTMRANPTITIYSAAGTAGTVSNGAGSDLAANSGIATSISDEGANIYNNSGGSITPSYNGFTFHYVASAEL